MKQIPHQTSKAIRDHYDMTHNRMKYIKTLYWPMCEPSMVRPNKFIECTTEDYKGISEIVDEIMDATVMGGRLMYDQKIGRQS